jgi:hypothetical protein
MPVGGGCDAPAFEDRLTLDKGVHAIGADGSVLEKEGFRSLWIGYHDDALVADGERVRRFVFLRPFMEGLFGISSQQTKTAYTSVSDFSTAISTRADTRLV